MFTAISYNLQRAVCMFLAVLVVSASLTVGATAWETAFENTYNAYTSAG